MVRDGEADYACVPIENSIEGSVLPTLDSLAMGSPLQVFAEFTLDIAFTIAVRPGAGEPASIAAFPVARAQVAKWAAKNLPRRQVPGRRLQRGGGRRRGTGSRRCRRNHRVGRATLRTRDAGHRRHRRAQRQDPVRVGRATRFASRRAPAPTAPRWCFAWTMFRVRWHQRLTEFAKRGIDLTRIESRPTRVELGTYIFFLDCAGHVDDEAVAAALEALQRRCADVRNLGSWPTGSAG